MGRDVRRYLERGEVSLVLLSQGAGLPRLPLGGAEQILGFLQLPLVVRELGFDLWRPIREHGAHVIHSGNTEDWRVRMRSSDYLCLQVFCGLVGVAKHSLDFLIQLLCQAGKDKRKRLCYYYFGGAGVSLSRCHVSPRSGEPSYCDAWRSLCECKDNNRSIWLNVEMQEWNCRFSSIDPSGWVRLNCGRRKNISNSTRANACAFACDWMGGRSNMC